MSLPIVQPFPPMEAETAEELPTGAGWQYEPKWDGFRCLAFRDGAKVTLQSKASKPLTRYFPELVEALGKLKAARVALDGEIIVQVEGASSFDDLLQRIHPAASRVKRLARETPATLVLFDLLVDARGRDLTALPLSDRRPRLEAFVKAQRASSPALRLSPATRQLRTARRWFDRVGGALDGVIAKRLAEPYRSGERAGMVKVKHLRTADCVVGGFRYARGTRVVGSLLLGLYDDTGLLHHVGFTSSLRHDERAELTRRLIALEAEPGFTGDKPGGPSRWSRGRDTSWVPLRPARVVEVEYDHFTGGRFRHGTRLLRWRPDKAPRQCRYDQVRHANRAPQLLK